MKHTILTAHLLLSLATLHAAEAPATFCNPLPIPNYPIGFFARNVTNGEPDARDGWLLGHREQFRELADPVVLWHASKWYLYPSGDMAWVSEDQGATWQHHPLNVREIGYPPTVVRHRDRFLLGNNSATLYASASPLGPFEKIGDLQLKPSGEIPPLMGKMLFSDDDGRLYLYFGVWITPYLREGGNIGRLEFENIDLRPAGQRAYDYVPPFLFWLAGKMEQVTLKNISSHAPIDDRPLVWIQPDAKIDRLRIDGLNVYDQRKEIGHTPLIRADGRIALLQVCDVVVQRPNATSPAGSLIGTSMDRTALKSFMDARAGIVTPPGKGRRGWPQGVGYLTSKPQIQRLQITDVVADGLELVLDHQAGTIEALDLRALSIPAATKVVHHGGEAKITKY